MPPAHSGYVAWADNTGISSEKEIPFSGSFFRSTGNRLAYLFVGHGKKIGKFPCPCCPFSQPDKPLKTPPNSTSFLIGI
jgi:hypothetical protein